jgi:excisionase family DNA binding protein
MQNTNDAKSSMALLTTHELSEWLRVKESTIRKWVCYDRIPYLKVGRLVVFQKEDIQLWLMRNNPKHERWSSPVKPYKNVTVAAGRFLSFLLLFSFCELLWTLWI